MDTELILEVGKTYINGQGELVKIVRKRDDRDDSEFAFVGDNDLTYRIDGVWFPGRVEEPHNLVKEVSVVPASQQAVVASAPIETDFSGDPKFARLRNTLLRAYLQVAEGKGAERHGNGKPWVEQPIFKIAEMVGTGFHLGQAIKKIEESTRMEDGPAVNELLGAMTYIAAAIESIETGHR